MVYKDCESALNIEFRAVDVPTNPVDAWPICNDPSIKSNEARCVEHENCIWQGDKCSERRACAKRGTFVSNIDATEEQEPFMIDPDTFVFAMEEGGYLKMA